ncbi:carbohydrate ABC transporter substrate-binding protein [Planosporangium flavigriseum]|uniref:ABC transporter substrate-binding protein n=1 Tax=Planosporangium flavigriseum TaxID=373681 RepID=A0A8J3LQ80_9ACTN|nr:ABC transporter substrate-binding protein [Planosporangium flavigriseum]NJC65135.1 carbohydrate ABC transporter substrate-binding protein [Planosporangium flavigriseum]GIG71751.1 ABC transporter substrate-binding protein [Planosporangium flavigriseum]
MRVATTRRSALVFGVGAMLVGSMLTGCGSSSDRPADSNGPVTLTVNLFGNFGYKDLYAEYKKSHPNITIKENITDFNGHHKNLQAHLLAGAGTADIEAIEVNQVVGFRPQAAKFVDFLSYGVNRDQWVEATWRRATGQDGTGLFGLGTDIGGLALCYRADVFKAAGLPAERDAVSKLFTDWNSYIEVGKQFQAKTPDKNVNWFDAGSNVFNAIVNQSQKNAYDESGKVIVEANPVVKQAWDTTVAGIQAGESAGLAAFSPQWNTGFQKGQFATVTCPSWMMAYIKDNAPETAGKWDIAKIPGTGGGNWGGSYLTVPKASRHQQEAVELAKWLTAPQQEKWLFTNKGNFPSDQALWSEPEVAGFTDPFFSSAPAGKIFSESVKSLKPQITGPHQGEIGNAIGNALQSVEQGKATPDDAWKRALADVKNLAG